jgi:hypothetical protein
MVDVMGIGIKADNRKMTSKRKSWEAAKEDSNYVSFTLSSPKKTQTVKDLSSTTSTKSSRSACRPTIQP